jgi:trimethylamine:corrinoid methyltransferase-like protein
VIDRGNRARWLKEGGMTLRQRAAREVERIVARYTPSRLPEQTKAELTRLMEREARRYGMEALPQA